MFNQKKKKMITTSNRQVTIDKRETSYEELVSKFENGEDGVYNLINIDKNIYLEPKIEITEEDIAEVPGLGALRQRIEEIEAQAKKAVGKRKYFLSTKRSSKTNHTKSMTTVPCCPTYELCPQNKRLRFICITMRICR